MTKHAVVIVAAGRGSRLGLENGPKQYRMLGNRSVLQHTIDCFANHQDIDQIQIVIHRDDTDQYAESVRPHPKLLDPVEGGATRQASCRAGVEALKDVDKVLIHDAARPFVALQTITNVMNEIQPGQCTLPGTAIADTVKRANPEGIVAETVPRESLFLAQTPQGFVHREILEAHQRAAEETDQDFTDDAAVAEWSGLKVKLVDGNKDNTKITTAEDLASAQERIEMTRLPDIRTGNGYDVHTLGPGTSVILCGHEIPHNRSLQGHSDADVGLHALTDALLGTIGAGDIGSHFPPTDEQWKGASSDRFISHAMNLVEDSGGTVTNMDVTLICEVPKIGPHRQAMREMISRICGVATDRISVKATTNEKIGFVGREEGIAALATVTVVFQ